MTLLQSFTCIISIITCVAGNITPILNMKKLRPERLNYSPKVTALGCKGKVVTQIYQTPQLLVFTVITDCFSDRSV